MNSNAATDASPIIDALLLTTIFTSVRAICTTLVAVTVTRSTMDAASASSVLVSIHGNRFTTEIISAVLGSYSV